MKFIDARSIFIFLLFKHNVVSSNTNITDHGRDSHSLILIFVLSMFKLHKQIFISEKFRIKTGDRICNHAKFTACNRQFVFIMKVISSNK
jgi:hypothetical protein